MARSGLTPFRAGGLSGGADPFLSLHREMNRLFEDVLRGASLFGGQGGSGQGAGGQLMIAPQIDVSENDREICIAAELPGVTEKDISVDLNEDVLVIRGEKKFEQRDEKENFHFVERSYGTFQRALQLPCAVDPEQVKASFENGILTITLPKAQRQERSRRIAVQSGGQKETQGQPRGSGEAGQAGGRTGSQAAGQAGAPAPEQSGKPEPGGKEGRSQGDGHSRATSA